MTAKLLLAVVAAVTTAVAACGALFAGMLSNAVAGCAVLTSLVAPSSQPSRPAGGYPRIGSWDSEQVGNAAVIVSVGAAMGVPPRGWVIAVATAMQESSLINLPNLGAGNDHDSLGLFQQRPSQGWGTPDQIMDPVYASTTFYQHLLRVPGWQAMTVAQAAQAVQKSRLPEAYSRWESDATTVVATLTGLSDLTIGCTTDGTGLVTPPSGYTFPPGTPPAVVIAIGWAFAQLGTPYHLGGDCTAARSGDPAHQCDCSSLVQQAYRAAGISLPRTAAQQSRVGTLIPDPSQLRPGDLMFIPGADGTAADPGHVGMYIGNGMIINAPHTGDVVHILPVNRTWLSGLTIRRVA